MAPADPVAGGALPINHAGGEYGGWEPLLTDGLTEAPVAGPAGELGFNAEVQPAPTITTLGPANGSTGGGTSVLIAGTDFEGARSVEFGGVPPSSFTGNSEGALTATAPPGAAGTAPVSVTTIAGTATSSEDFTYFAPAVIPISAPAPVAAKTCKTPDLKGKNLKAAKKKLKVADCKLGTVTKKIGVAAKSGKVVKQNPKAGKVLDAGAKVKVVRGG